MVNFSPNNFWFAYDLCKDDNTESSTKSGQLLEKMWVETEENKEREGTLDKYVENESPAQVLAAENRLTTTM